MILTEIGRVILKVMFHTRFNLRYTFDDFDPNTKKPYILIGNHATQHDPLLIGMRIKRYPYPVANSFLYTSKVLNFLLTKIVHSISKRKGQSDAQTILKIMRTIKEEKRGVMLFPEGNASYFGKESPVLYDTTAKLLKKLDVDVVFAKIRGGYLSHPRWGHYVKKGHFHIHMYTLIKQDALKSMSMEHITDILKEAFVFNDYTWNQMFKHSYALKNRLNGLEHYLYYCPKCQGIQTLKGYNETLLCKTCGEIAKVDTYTQLQGPYPSFIEWDQDQKQQLSTITQTPVVSIAKVYDTNLVERSRKHLGTLKTTLSPTHLTIHTKEPLVFDIHALNGVVITQKNRLSFDVGDKTYNLLIQDPMLYLDYIQYIKERSHGTMVND